MKIEHINPAGLLKPKGYTHVITVEGGKTAYIAGQGAYDTNWNLVGEGDHYAQGKQSFTNLIMALEGIGATLESVVKCTIYVVSLNADTLAAVTKGMADAAGKRIPPTASTMVGVERLAFDGMLVEIDAVVVV
ncbi:MAG: RidA family protein [Chloroflexi bacterium]|nr:RidA family protein [Chloroflexota bacterium]